jgi:uncharacterized LabA/DUF88 family protein
MENLLNEDNEIVKIKYFTARVKARTYDVTAPERQNAYLRALKQNCKNLEIHYGSFRQDKTRMANANPPPNTIEVIKTEEKGSDVNLAVSVLNDAWLNSYDCAVVVSNDSDMEGALKLVKAHHPQKIIGVITPGARVRTSQKLKKHSDFTKTIRTVHLENALLPRDISEIGISKPDEW